MQTFYFVPLVAILLCSCGENAPNPRTDDSLSVAKSQITSFDINWNGGLRDPNCIRIYKADYVRNIDQGNYIIGCSQPGNPSVIYQELTNKHIILTAEQAGLIAAALDNIALDALSQRYGRNDLIADGVTFELTFYSDKGSKSLSVDASSSISSIPLVHFLDAINSAGFISESGYPS